MANTMTIVFTLLVLVFRSEANDDYLPTVSWNEDSPVLARKYWSNVVNVRVHQVMSFMCPNDKITMFRYQSSFTQKSYYNLYVREILPNDTELNYDRICDPNKSFYISSCNMSGNNVDLSSDFLKGFRISTNQARKELPSFKHGKDYIFFSTSNGSKETLKTSSTKCTMVFRIHFCNKDVECPTTTAKCATYGREEACSTPPSPSPGPLVTSPRDVRITANSTSSLTVSWQPPLTTSSNITYYSICYRRLSSDECSTTIAEPHARTAILENLNASTLYRTRVRAHTCQGPGNYSLEIIGKTTKIKTVDHFIASEPRELSVLADSSTSLLVSWTVPKSHSDTVLYYSICYRSDRQQQCRTQLAEASQRSAQLQNLNQSTKYFVRVRAETCAGPGAYSDEKEASVKSPITGKESGEAECKGIEWVSFIVGLVTGIFPTLAIALLVGYFLKKRWKKEVKSVRTATNNAYRSSTISDDHILNIPNVTTPITTNNTNTVELDTL